MKKFKFTELILHALGIKTQEKKTVLQSSYFAFIGGAVQCYFVAIPMSLFLIQYSGASLPQVYLLAAILGLALGSIFLFFESRLSYNHLMPGLFLVLGGGTLLICFFCYK